MEWLLDLSLTRNNIPLYEHGHSLSPDYNNQTHEHGHTALQGQPENSRILVYGPYDVRTGFPVQLLLQPEQELLSVS